MLVIKCTSRYLMCFTYGRSYYVHKGDLENGCYVTDDDNEEHFLTAEFLIRNFKEV